MSTGSFSDLAEIAFEAWRQLTVAAAYQQSCQAVKADSTPQRITRDYSAADNPHAQERHVRADIIGSRFVTREGG